MLLMRSGHGPPWLPPRLCRRPREPTLRPACNRKSFKISWRSLRIPFENEANSVGIQRINRTILTSKASQGPTKLFSLPLKHHRRDISFTSHNKQVDNTTCLSLLAVQRRLKWRPIFASLKRCSWPLRKRLEAELEPQP